jgi:hypothetical protein
MLFLDSKSRFPCTSFYSNFFQNDFTRREKMGLGNNQNTGLSRALLSCLTKKRQRLRKNRE